MKGHEGGEEIQQPEMKSSSQGMGWGERWGVGNSGTRLITQRGVRAGAPVLSLSAPWTLTGADQGLGHPAHPSSTRSWWNCGMTSQDQVYWAGEGWR